ncbi:MAG: 3'-5' exonuclease [Pelagimonas sp.]|uniref:3'-5' exonuclease n=1 Tax=Pelagimonas sp. TaxID=2073170 RepID=UPI003D6A9F5A
MRPLPLGPFRFVALDVETASGQPASICQIGLACVDHSNHIHSYVTYVDPETGFAPFNVQLHGIGPETVAGAPTFPQIWAELLPFLAPCHLVQHSKFDSKAIAAACKQYRLPRPDLSWSDSVRIARQAWPEFKGNGGHGLGHLKTALALEFTHHDAGEDARASAEVVLLAEEKLAQPFETIAQTKHQAQMSLPL